MKFKDYIPMSSLSGEGCNLLTTIMIIHECKMTCVVNLNILDHLIHKVQCTIFIASVNGLGISLVMVYFCKMYF